MLKPIKMPGLSTTEDKVKIIGWLKKEGDPVERGEVLLEVETDKANMEVESYLKGYLVKIEKKAGQEADEGDVIGYIGDKEDSLAKQDTQENNNTAQQSPEHESTVQKNTARDAKPEPGPEKDVDTPTPSKNIKISPMVKKLAEKMGVNIDNITGTGPGGLILKEDILNASGDEKAKGREVKAVPYTRVGKAIARNMSKSKREIPHVYFNIDIDASAMIALREKSSKKLSYNAMIIYNTAKTLVKHPYLASVYSEDARLMPESINIGFAAAKGDELFVPVIKNIGTDGLDLKGVEEQIKRLTHAINSGSIKQEDITGSTFTITNLGAYGITSFNAVINPPEAAILAVGSIQDKVTAVNGSIVIRPVLTITLSVDHRVVNGTHAGEFLKELKENIENMKE